jgi:hypothetical protein
VVLDTIDATLARDQGDKATKNGSVTALVGRRAVDASRTPKRQSERRQLEPPKKPSQPTPNADTHTLPSQPQTKKKQNNPQQA